MKRTNNIYNVQVARYAWIAVEADNPKEAMQLAGQTDLEECIGNETFEDSDIYVESCETYSNEIDDMFLEDNEYVITTDGAMTVEEYCRQLEKENEE